jgi:TRAP-type mannitol/chloroaromatic compound transport system permease small subunit
MSKSDNVVSNVIDAISRKTGKVVSYAVLLIMFITALDVVARYVFNNPLLWGWLLNRQLFGVFILFAGIYAMATGMHIRIEIFYDHFPRRLKRIARLIALACLVAFLGVLVWQGAWMGWNSLMMGEKAAGAFRVPLYPFKLLIPIAALLFLLEGIVVFLRGEDETGAE